MQHLKKISLRILPSILFLIAYAIDMNWLGRGFILFSPIILFFYVFSNPLLLNPLYVVSLSFLFDLYSGLPAGLHSFPLLLLYALVVFYRKNLRSPDFTSTWGLFALLLFGTEILKWALLSMIQNNYWAIQYMLIPSFFTAILYPWFQIILPKQR